VEKRDLVIRFGGETGGGLQSIGQLVTKAAATVGFQVLTFYSPPAEIKGGQAVFEVRLSGEQLYARAETLDILWAFDEEGYENGIKDLRPGGLLLYDPSDMGAPPAGNYRALAVPVTEIAKTRLRFERGKNVVAFGMAAALFDLPKEPLVDLLKKQFKRHLDLLPQNVTALEAGITWVEEHVPDRAQYRLQAAPPIPGVMVLNGNQALSLGALAAGCRFLAGYPITPATEIMEFMAAHLPGLGGTVVQAEDEISAMGMVLGASYAGKKAMTSTSGPGFSLMIEMLGLSSMAELPCVIVDAQRAGPSTGMPTRHEQGDLNLAVYGGHGEVPKFVFAPVSVRDCFNTTVDAFNFAESYQLPVILLQDTVLAVRTESVERPELHQLHFELAEPQRHLAAERHRRPRQPGHALDGAKEPRKALDLALHVLRATLDDQIVRVLARDDLARRIAGCAEHAHRVVVRQHDVRDRLVGDAADPAEHVLGHHRRRLRIGDQHDVVADDDPGIGIAFGRVCVRVIGEAVEADRLFLHVRLGCKRLVHRRLRLRAAAVCCAS
jgi:2-oxoacid:acceptor oxidoreductase alpha subunit